jgi:hypothetical protein
MNGRNVEQEVGEFFRRVAPPEPSWRLREAVSSGRLRTPTSRKATLFVRRTALSLVGLAATFFVVASLFLVVQYRGSQGGSKPTPQENWTRIENTWMPGREDARHKIVDAMSDFNAQIDGYKAFRDATRGWMNELAAVGDWSDPAKSAQNNATVETDMKRFIQSGNDQADLLDRVAVAKVPDEVTVLATQITESETTFSADFALISYDLMGSRAVAPRS